MRNSHEYAYFVGEPQKRRFVTFQPFFGSTRQLIEILAATGHKAEAESICAQAVGVLEDARLKSAVIDAVNRVARTPHHAP